MIDTHIGSFVLIDRYSPGCQLCSLKIAPTTYWDDGKYIDMHCKITFLFASCEATSSPEVLEDEECTTQA
jgi:hypothetical protein